MPYEAPSISPHKETHQDGGADEINVGGLSGLLADLQKAGKLNSGLDADKSASPEVGDVYLATDTDKIYKCITAGAWTLIDATLLANVGLADGNVAKLPTATEGKVLKRGTTNWEAGDPPVAAINKGKTWIAHGNNVITFPTAHSNNNYRWVVSLVQAEMGGITPRNVRHTTGLSIFVSNESITRGKVRIEGGYGFTSCGYTTAAVGTTERFDDVANTHTARADATARRYPAGYSLNEYFINYITLNE